MTKALLFVHLQLIDDAYKYKVQIEHISGVINRFKAKQRSIERTFQIDEEADSSDGMNCAVSSKKFEEIVKEGRKIRRVPNDLQSKSKHISDHNLTEESIPTLPVGFGSSANVLAPKASLV